MVILEQCDLKQLHLRPVRLCGWCGRRLNRRQRKYCCNSCLLRYNADMRKVKSFNKSSLQSLYSELTPSQIAIKYDVNPVTIHRYLGIYNIPKRNKQEIGKILSRQKQRGRNPNWKNGIRLSHGYRLILAPNHPRANTNRRYVPEHILVWEAAHGRYLPEGYIIHHLNGIKSDNRIANLAAVPTREHKYVIPAYRKRIRQLEAELAEQSSQGKLL